MTEYDQIDNFVTALSFKINLDDHQMSFRLPTDWKDWTEDANGFSGNSDGHDRASFLALRGYARRPHFKGARGNRPKSSFLAMASSVAKREAAEPTIQALPVPSDDPPVLTVPVPSPLSFSSGSPSCFV